MKPLWLPETGTFLNVDLSRFYPAICFPLSVSEPIRLTQTESQRADDGLIPSRRTGLAVVSDSYLHEVKTGHSELAAFPVCSSPWCGGRRALARGPSGRAARWVARGARASKSPQRSRPRGIFVRISWHQAWRCCWRSLRALHQYLHRNDQCIQRSLRNSSLLSAQAQEHSPI